MTLGAKAFDLGVAFSVTRYAEENVLGGLSGQSPVADLEMKIDAGGLDAIYAKRVRLRIVCTEDGAAPGAWVWKRGRRALAAVRKLRVLACAALGTDYGSEEIGGQKRPPFEGMHVALSKNEIANPPSIINSEVDVKAYFVFGGKTHFAFL